MVSCFLILIFDLKVSGVSSQTKVFSFWIMTDGNSSLLLKMNRNVCD